MNLNFGFGFASLATAIDERSWVLGGGDGRDGAASTTTRFRSASSLHLPSAPPSPRRAAVLCAHRSDTRK